MERLIWSFQTEDFWRKRDFLKGSPKISIMEFPNGKSAFHLFHSTILSIPVKMSVEMKHAHPMQISIRGFDAPYLLQYSTNRFFRLNGKQPRFYLESSLSTTVKANAAGVKIQYQLLMCFGDAGYVNIYPLSRSGRNGTRSGGILQYMALCWYSMTRNPVIPGLSDGSWRCMPTSTLCCQAEHQYIGAQWFDQSTRLCYLLRYH